MYETENSEISSLKADKNSETKVDENKINLICEKLVFKFEELNSTRYFISILSCHAKMNDLDGALKKIIQFRSKLT